MTSLDAKGRCCGRKPLVYKTYQGGGIHPPFKFCTHCGSHFNMEGQQVEDNEWKWISGRLQPKGSPTDDQLAIYHGDCDGDAGL